MSLLFVTTAVLVLVVVTGTVWMGMFVVTMGSGYAAAMGAVDVGAVVAAALGPVPVAVLLVVMRFADPGAEVDLTMTGSGSGADTEDTASQNISSGLTGIEAAACLCCGICICILLGGCWAADGMLIMLMFVDGVAVAALDILSCYALCEREKSSFCGFLSTLVVEKGTGHFLMLSGCRELAG